MKKKIFIEGMKCGHCTGHVKSALEVLDNVASVEVSLEGKYAIVEGNVEDKVLRDVIEEEGYDVIRIE